MAWTAPCAPSLGAGLSPSYQSSFPGPPHPIIGGWKNRSANRPMGASLLGWASLVRHCAVWLLMYSLSVATSSSFSPCRHSYCDLEAQRAICRFRTSIACLTSWLDQCHRWAALSLAITASTCCRQVASGTPIGLNNLTCLPTDDCRMYSNSRRSTFPVKGNPGCLRSRACTSTHQ